ncbi:protein-tyrosine phosphatase [Yoonia maritima]|uniref:protein-tyrosine-phosphatase n=1 Tax=Yoonia maritima TaxID=1435347 RepID=A0A2T0W2Y2_9RHOB|nr:low molecular weight protein-tyrosine-phosphatase [Yoonia maritima]PRY79581.1 protein-tyrosine phosphatase [Yoonia maritima]
MRVLFVCLGNICRSPAAEGVVRAMAPHLTLDSAGTGGWHVGDPPYGPMQEAAGQRGYDLSPLRARQFTAEDFDAFDLIVAMDRQNRADIERLRPSGNDTPVRLMAAQDVPDPYYTRDFDGCLDIIEDAARIMLREHRLETPFQ